MRIFLLLAGTATLAACGGGSGGSVSSTPSPLANGPSSTHTFANPTEAKTYVGVGGSQVFSYKTDDRGCCNQQAQVYAGSATTIRNSGIEISYDPRDAIFTLKVVDPNSGANTNTRFQDPASRTDFGGTREPQWGTPQLTNQNIRYLQAGDGNPLSPYVWSGSGFVNVGNNSTPAQGLPGSTYQATSFFYLRPGTETRYVTFAGYARNSFTFSQTNINGTLANVIDSKLERGAFAYGEVTNNRDVPTTGSGSYRGSMLASMVFNPTLDGQDISGSTVLPSYFQWLDGTATLNVDFLRNAFELALSGKVSAPQLDFFTGPQLSVIQAGATFTASGSGTINLSNFGGFKGAFASAALTNPNGQVRNVTIAGSSIDGAFYGPKAEEAGGGFRIVGGNPDERIDILGTFVGVK